MKPLPVKVAGQKAIPEEKFKVNNFDLEEDADEIAIPTTM